MKKHLIASLLLLNFAIADAQHKIVFETKLAESKTKGSLYNSIKLIDSRRDSTLGTVKTGAFDRTAIVVTKQPLRDELTSILNSIIDTGAAKNTLLLHLRQLSYAEMTLGMTEHGYFAFQADLYAQQQDKYRLIASVDTMLHLRSGIDVTNALLKAGSDTLTGFIQTNILKQPSGTVAYSYNDVAHMDSIEKLAIKVYNTQKYTDGLYLTYKSFQGQTPDNIVKVTGNYVYPGNVQTPNEKGKLKDVKLNKTYAIVYNGEPYIVTEYGFYPLKKVDRDFMFTGKARVSASTGTMIAGSMFGLLGALMASGDDATFEMKIDHKNGTPIKLKKIEEPKPVSNGSNWSE